MIVRALRCVQVLRGADVIVGMDVLSKYVVTLDRGQLNVAAVTSPSYEHRIEEKVFQSCLRWEGVDGALGVEVRLAGDKKGYLRTVS